MNTLTAAAFLLKQLLNLLLTLWPIGVFLIALTLIGGFVNRRFLNDSRFRILYSNFLLLILASCILVAGAVWHQPFLTNENISYVEPSAWLVRSVYVLLIIHIGVAAMYIWQAKYYRFFAISSASLTIWLALLNSFLALMAISGSWL